MNKKEIAKILEEIGIILDLKDENPFKIRAYYNGARIIETLDKDIKILVENGELARIKGIGQALSEKISVLVTTGSLPFYEELKSSIPEGLLSMLKIPGLGAKKVKIIHKNLSVTTIGELEYACRENRLRDLQGFGQKSQDKILQSIEKLKKYSKRFLFPVAEEVAQGILEYLKKNTKLKAVEVAGSLRRKMETVKNLDIIGCCDNNNQEELMEYFVNYDQSVEITGKGMTKAAIILNTGITVELRLVDEKTFPFLLLHVTGSKEHNTQMRRLAKENKMILNEYGLFRGGQLITCSDEKEIFKNLGLPFIPPELRESMGEIDAAKEGTLPELYDGIPFYGLFHVHTTYSDGANTMEEIALSCQKMGFDYVGICDHSKSAFYANGLTEERVIQQHKEIDQLNKKNREFKIFKGIEVDILTDGSLDYDNSVLASFDFVIASIHSQFNLTEDKMTERICRALRNPHVTMLGHPTGRLLLAREPYAVNMYEVLKVAGENDKMIEINASPYRLDLDWRWGKIFRKKGVKTALNPDAHSIDGLADFKYGIGISRKGWFEKSDILNTYTTTQVTKIFNK